MRMMTEALVGLIDAQLELERLQLRERGVAAHDAANDVGQLRDVGDLRRIVERLLENDHRSAAERHNRHEHLTIEYRNRRRRRLAKVREADAERLLELPYDRDLAGHFSKLVAD